MAELMVPDRTRVQVQINAKKKEQLQQKPCLGIKFVRIGAERKSNSSALLSTALRIATLPKSGPKPTEVRARGLSPLSLLPLELQQLAGFCIKQEAKHGLKPLPGRFKLPGPYLGSELAN